MKKICLTLLFIFCFYGTVTAGVTKSPSSGDVKSVNSETPNSAGNVTITTGDITEDADNNYVTDTDITNLGNLSGENSGDNASLSRDGGNADRDINIGAYGLTTNDLTVNNDTTHTGKTKLIGQLSGDGVYIYMGVAEKRVENLIRWSDDLSQSSVWQLFANVTWGSDNKTITSTRGDILGARLEEVAEISNLNGKSMIWSAKVKAATAADRGIRGRLVLSGGSIESVHERLFYDRWTNLRLPVTHVSDTATGLMIANQDCVNPYNLMLDNICVREAVEPAILAIGDSFFRTIPEAGFAQLPYSQLFFRLLADDEKVDFTVQATAGDTISDIHDDLTNIILPTRIKYPVVIIDGGGNDVASSTSDQSATWFTQAVSTIDDLKEKVSNHIYYMGCPDFPNLTVNPSFDRRQWIQNFDALMAAKYESDPSVTFVDIFPLTGNVEYYDESPTKIHLNTDGQFVVYEELKKFFVLPYSAQTYECPETGSFVIVADTNKTIEEKIHINEYDEISIDDTDCPYTMTAKIRKIYVDTNDDNCTILLEAGTEISKHKFVNADNSTGNHVKFVPNGSELIDGANDNTTMSKGIRDYNYFTGKGWW